MLIDRPHDLVVLINASRILAEAKTLDVIKEVRDKAEAARAYVKAARLGLEIQNRAAELKLRAERKAGEFLKSLKLRGGDRRSKRQSTTLKLSELGITRDQSKRWQYVASVSEADFCQYLLAMNEQSREITSAGLIRIAKQERTSSPEISRSSVPHRTSRRSKDTEGGSIELIDELTNHCQLLGNLLEPIFDKPSGDLKIAEKRFVRRLVREIAELITELKKSWPEGQTRPDRPRQRDRV